jgi:hypothetical protein
MVFGGLIGSPQDIQRSFQLVQCLNMPYKAQDTPLRKKSVEMSMSWSTHPAPSDREEQGVTAGVAEIRDAGSAVGHAPPGHGHGPSDTPPPPTPTTPTPDTRHQARSPAGASRRRRPSN